MDLQLSLKHSLQSASQYDQYLKKINKLHDKLASDAGGQEISAKAAVKLLMAYEAAVRSSQSLHDLCKLKEGKEESEVVVAETPVVVVEAETEEPVAETVPVQVTTGPANTTTEPAVEPVISSAEVYLAEGTIVAVLCHVDEDTESEDWMLATVHAFHPEERLYEVIDCEVPEGSPPEQPAVAPSPEYQGKRRMIPLARILPLPTPSQVLEEEAEHKPRTEVLALYPGTTCLYPAQILSGPSRRKKTRDYLVRFADDEVSSRPCPPCYIVPAPQMQL